MEFPDSSRSSSNESKADSKEWKLIEKTVATLGVEQRRARRWGIFFKLLTFAYLFLLLGVMANGLGSSAITAESYTALVDVRGLIADQEEASADVIVTGLRAAFEAEGSKAVVLRINSPGGSPVQSGYVYDEVKRLRGLYPDKKLYAVITDLGASGAYYMAAAADEIYADKASLVGSIGVTAAGFGFVEAMDELGVERRNYTSGQHKSFLDPFSEENPEEVKFWKGVLDSTHQQFISKVKEGRGDRLSDDARLFTGLIWNGEQALELGLVDGLGSSGFVAREIIGAEEIVDFTVQPDAFAQFTESLGVSIGRAISTSVGGNMLQLR